MPHNKESIRKKIKEFQFKKLFIEELGWDKFDRNSLELNIDKRKFFLNPVSEKRGLAVFACNINVDEDFPDYSLRRKIEHQLTKNYFEHLIIFSDTNRTRQIWQWVKREQGKPDACREHSYYSNQSGEALIQKLENLFVSIEDEEALTLSETLGKVKGAFDVEKVTKKFYERFQKEHESFAKFIKGIPDAEIKKWYVSIMMNRLMFIYFIQKKNFLNNDNDYLRKKLAEVKADDKNLFYKDFLLKLFFAGFAKKEDERTPDEKKLLGVIPYLNGGLFLKHQIESENENIEIADEAFEKILDFFDLYQWHLDERPLKKDNEINPDVLGYIFEKYINQKQMGAYYTKEDITEYISKNTIIPFIFDEAKKECSIAFKLDSALWKLLKENPDRYIYKAVKHGTALPLPEEYEIGLDTTKPKLLERRKNWNERAPKEFALPTEIWREVIDRRKRYEEVKSKIINGEINEINDFITYNLNVRQFTQDVIENSEGPELVRAFFKAINNVSVLDPTCGSGAFLFAALNILEPMYEACIGRMEIFVEELEHTPCLQQAGGPSHAKACRQEGSKYLSSDESSNKLEKKKFRSDKFSDFKIILKEIEEHASAKYYIYKKIILNNLFGVDIMHEAVEIAKLRLFLKLVAQIENVNDIEPLPDIDFNLKSGNTLVGYAKFEDVEKSLKFKQQSIDTDYDKVAADIKEKAEMCANAYERFREMQDKKGMDAKDFRNTKETLTSRLASLNEELNKYLARDYGKLPTIEKSYKQWKESHQPFHWFVEFYEIIQNRGGFDVIIGNPPYVEYSKVKNEYTIKNYETESCGNLYAFVMESTKIILQKLGKIGFIIPISFVSSERMNNLRMIFTHRNSISWISNFAIRPQPLFQNIMQRNTIFIFTSISKANKVFATKYLRWTSLERDNLFKNIVYFDLVSLNKLNNQIPKIHKNLEASILNKIENSNNKKLEIIFRSIIRNDNLYYHDSGESYWTKTLWDKPKAYRNGKLVEPSQWFSLPISGKFKSFVYILLNSNFNYWSWCVFTDCRHMTRNYIENLLIPQFKNIDHELVDKLKEAYKENTLMYEKREGYKSPEIKVQNFKPIIDEIDKVLAEHYGFTEEELDFIINYDIKYRMGKSEE